MEPDRLPEFRDLNSVEKIVRLPRELTMDGVPVGDDPEPQNIGYYAPSDDLVFYYDDSATLTALSASACSTAT